MRLLAYLSLAVLMIGSGVASGRDAPVSVDGAWAGEMRQVDVEHENRYPMSITLKGAKGTTSYPSLKCGGTLSRIGTTKSGYVLYQESVKNDPGAGCIDGIVLVTTDAGKLILGWYAAFEGAPSLASAVLTQEKK